MKRTIQVHKPFTLTHDDHSTQQFLVGVHEVDEHVAEHWYVQAHATVLDLVAETPAESEPPANDAPPADPGANPPADSEQPVADPAASDADSQKTDDSQETDAKTKKRK